MKFLLLLQTVKSCTFQAEVLEFLMLNSGICCKALWKLQADCGVCLD